MILALGCLLTIYQFGYQKRTKDYVTVQAKIERIEQRRSRTLKNRYNKQTYITYSYSYQGKSYQTKVEVFYRARRKQGEMEKIQINPKNPKEVENKRIVWISMRVVVGFLFITILLAAIVRKQKKQ